MDSFEKREKSFEGKFVHDEELRFKIAARRDKLLGLWAASKMYMEPEESARYAKELVSADLEEVGTDDVVLKLLDDMKKAGVSITKNEIQEKLNEFQKQAEKQIKEEIK